ncbi:MAG: AAA family ATPase [Bdellovibrionales bacterium]|nr:AAA family ATPase [Bdellovibrionales bacterium]
MKIIGHYHQRESLARLCRAGKIPSSLMFAGTEGVGKQLVARALAKSLIANDFSDLLESKENSDNQNSILLDSGNHPDFYFVDCASKDFNIEALRDLLYRLHLKTYIANARVIVLNDANFLSNQAANALLKTLEEPRPGTFFILICTNPAIMPSTIRSRCQLWFFDRLKESEVISILKNQDSQSDLSIEEKAKIADGAMKNLSELEKHLPIWPEIKERLLNIAQGDTFEAHTFAETLSKDKESLKEKLHLIRMLARQEMHESRQKIEKRRWAYFLNNTIEIEYLIFQRNFNATYILASVFSALSNSIDKNLQNEFCQISEVVTI